MLTDLLIVLALVLLNGVFAMSEIAVVSSRKARPIVTLLSVSTDTILRLFAVRQVKQPAVTLEEIKVLLEQGADEGVFEVAEHEMVTNVLNLDDRHVGSVLTPRSDNRLPRCPRFAGRQSSEASAGVTQRVAPL